MFGLHLSGRSSRLAYLSQTRNEASENSKSKKAHGLTELLFLESFVLSFLF